MTKRKSTTAIVITLNSRQMELLDGLDELYGLNHAEKVSAIVTDWLCLNVLRTAIQED